MGLLPLEIFEFCERGNRLYTSESAVYRRQILTYKQGTRAERAGLAKLFNLNFHPPKVVSRSGDPQLQVGDNHLGLTNGSEQFRNCVY